MDTIEAAVLLAASHHAALVPLLNSYASDGRKGVRLDISVARVHLPLSTVTSAARRPAHTRAASAQRAGE